MYIKEEKLSHEYLLSILNYNEETGFLTWKVKKSKKTKIHDIAGCYDRDGYVMIRIDGNKFMSHRLIWFYFYNKWPENQIDHINGIKDDNRIKNLRDVTGFQNMQNQRKAMITNKSSGLLGVTFDKNRDMFMSQITINRKVIRIGFFHDPMEAHNAYLDKKRTIHTHCTI